MKHSNPIAIPNQTATKLTISTWRDGGTYVIDFTIGRDFVERQEETEWCGPMD